MGNNFCQCAKRTLPGWVHAYPVSETKSVAREKPLRLRVPLGDHEPHFARRRIRVCGERERVSEQAFSDTTRLIFRFDRNRNEIRDQASGTFRVPVGREHEKPGTVAVELGDIAGNSIVLEPIPEVVVITPVGKERFVSDGSYERRVILGRSPRPPEHDILVAGGLLSSLLGLSGKSRTVRGGHPWGGHPWGGHP